MAETASSPAPIGSPPTRRWFVWLGIAAVVCALAMVNGLSLRQATRLRGLWPAEADTFHLPPSRALRFASLGHHELAADLLHGKANVYFGTQVMAKTHGKWLARYLHAAIDLDPRFHRLYLSGSTMIVYGGSKIDINVLDSANEILERGRAVFPLDWEIPFQLGFNYYYEMPTAAKPGDPRVPGWRQKGLEYLQFASQFEGVPYYLPSLVARLLTKQGAAELAIGQLERAYAATSNEQARESIRNKLLSLRGQSATRRLEHQRRDFVNLLSSRYPYVPEALNLLLGPKMTATGILAPPAEAPAETP